MTVSRLSGRAWFRLPRPIRFAAVGVLNTLFGYGAYALLLYLGLHYALAAFFGTIAGVLFNFLTTGKLVFDSVAGSRLGRFVAAYAATYLLNVACLAGLAATGLGPYAAGAVCLLPMAAISYVLMRSFVFGWRGWH